MTFAAAALLLSCATQTGIEGKSSSAAVSSADTGTGASADARTTAESAEEYNVPPAVEVSGVIDFLSGEYSYLWNTAAKGGTPVFFASTPRREFREEEAEYCLYDAARQVSLYHAAKVETKLAVKSDNRDLGYKESVKTGFDRDLALKVMKDLVVVRHLRDTEGTYMLVKYPGLTVDVDWEGGSSSVEGDLPSWITGVPEIRGRLVSVGVVQRSRYLTDSLKKADDQVLANLSRQVSINVKSKRTDLEAGRDTAFAELHYDVSSSIIKGFYILARWRSGDGNIYYSLGVCEKGIKD